MSNKPKSHAAVETAKSIQRLPGDLTEGQWLLHASGLIAEAMTTETANQIHDVAQTVGMSQEEARDIVWNLITATNDWIKRPDDKYYAQEYEQARDAVIAALAAQPPAALVETLELPAESVTDGSPTTRGLGVRSGGSQPIPSELDANGVSDRDSRERPATHNQCSADNGDEQ